MTGRRFTQPEPAASTVGDPTGHPGVLADLELELLGRGRVTSGGRGRRRPAARARPARSAGCRRGRTTNLEKPTSRKRSSMVAEAVDAHRHHRRRIHAPCGSRAMAWTARGVSGMVRVADGHPEVLGADRATRPPSAASSMTSLAPRPPRRACTTDGSQPSANRPHRRRAAGTMPAGPELQGLLDGQRRHGDVVEVGGVAVVGDRLAAHSRRRSGSISSISRPRSAAGRRRRRPTPGAGAMPGTKVVSSRPPDSTSRVASSLASRTGFRPGSSMVVPSLSRGLWAAAKASADQGVEGRGGEDLRQPDRVEAAARRGRRSAGRRPGGRRRASAPIPTPMRTFTGAPNPGPSAPVHGGELLHRRAAQPGGRWHRPPRARTPATTVCSGTPQQLLAPPARPGPPWWSSRRPGPRPGRPAGCSRRTGRWTPRRPWCSDRVPVDGGQAGEVGQQHQQHRHLVEVLGEAPGAVGGRPGDGAGTRRGRGARPPGRLPPPRGSARPPTRAR